MKDITPIPSKDAETQRVVDELHNWIDRHITDETVGFAIVSVGSVKGGAVIEHKSACGGPLTRHDLAVKAYNAISEPVNAKVIDQEQGKWLAHAAAPQSWQRLG